MLYPRWITEDRNPSDGLEIRLNSTIGSHRILPTVIRWLTAFSLRFRLPNSPSSYRINVSEPIRSDRLNLSNPTWFDTIRYLKIIGSHRIKWHLKQDFTVKFCIFLSSEHVGLWYNRALPLIEFDQFRQPRSDRNHLFSIIGCKRKTQTLVRSRLLVFEPIAHST